MTSVRRLACASLFVAFVVALAAVAHAETPPIYFTKWGSAGSLPGQFQSPTALGVDSDGYVYVCDRDPDRIQKFTGSGDYVTSWPGLAYDFETGRDDIIYTAAASAVGVYSTSGTHYFDITPPVGAPPFTFVTGVSLGPDSTLYVVDSGGHRVDRYSTSGNYLSSWGSHGSGLGQFDVPIDIAWDEAGGVVYVTDSNNNRVQEFTTTGDFIAYSGSLGSGDGEFTTPWGVDVDGAGNVYVADLNNQRIQKFSSAGAMLTKWGAWGSGNGQFYDPIDVALDRGGSVYVCENNNNRIQKFIIPPAIAEITDVPNDQGRQVRIHFSRSTLDGSVWHPALQYEAYREIPTAALSGWEFVGAVPANAGAEYDIVVPTLGDEPEVSTFYIRAATTAPAEYSDSSPASGGSTDNLAPAAPGGFTAIPGGGETHLSWNPNSEPDLAGYRLYRGQQSDFVPSLANRIGQPTGTAFVVGDETPSYYKVSAVDVNGNEGAFSLADAGVLAVGPVGAPGQMWLAAAQPTPARVRTQFRFALPHAGAARLVILDATGRFVCELVREQRPAGEHSVTWNLRGASGAPAPSGVYFARFEFEGQALVRRIAVLR